MESTWFYTKKFATFLQITNGVVMCRVNFSQTQFFQPVFYRQMYGLFQIKDLTEELEVVQSQLPETNHKLVPDVPSMKPDELPEK